MAGNGPAKKNKLENYVFELLAGNRLKKFVRREGIYKPEILADDLNERSEEEEEKEDESEEGQLRTGDPFEIVVHQLDEDKKKRISKITHQVVKK